MSRCIARGIVALGALLPVAALAQDARPAFSPDEIAAMLDRSSGTGRAFTPDEIATILDTSASPRKRGTQSRRRS